MPSLYFHIEPDYTFCNHQRLLDASCTLLVVVETEPVALHNGFRIRLRIIQFFTFLLLGRAINPVPLMTFVVRVVVKTLRKFPHIGDEPVLFKTDRTRSYDMISIIKLSLHIDKILV